MLYVLMGEDRPDTLEARLAARPAHLARIEALRDDGRLLVAGPMPAIDASDPGPAGFFGSLIIAEFDSIETAQQWFDDDPYTKENVFARTLVKPYRKVMP